MIEEKLIEAIKDIPDKKLRTFIEHRHNAIYNSDNHLIKEKAMNELSKTPYIIKLDFYDELISDYRRHIYGK